MAMNIKAIVEATRTVADGTDVVFVNNETREQTRNLSYSPHPFRNNHSMLAFDKAPALGNITAADLRERLTDELGENHEWAGNMGQGPVYTVTEETEIAITEDYRDGKGRVVAYFANEAENELLFFIADAD